MVLDNVRYYFDGRLHYFYVDDILEKYDFARIPENHIHEFEVDGKMVRTVLPDAIEILSEFDLMILRAREKK